MVCNGGGGGGGIHVATAVSSLLPPAVRVSISSFFSPLLSYDHNDVVVLLYAQ